MEILFSAQKQLGLEDVQILTIKKPSLYLLGPFRKLFEEAHGDESPGHPPRGDGGDAQKNSSYEPQWCHDVHICWNTSSPNSTY